MRKFTLIFALVMGVVVSMSAQRQVTFENVEYCSVGAIFNKVSNTRPCSMKKRHSASSREET